MSGPHEELRKVTYFEVCIVQFQTKYCYFPLSDAVLEQESTTSIMSPLRFVLVIVLAN